MNKISYDERVRVYTNAFVTNGERIQMIVALEELSELQKEICKVLRGKGNMEHLAEEIADVKIILEQIEYLYPVAEDIERIMDEKINRLQRGLYDKGMVQND